MVIIRLAGCFTQLLPRPFVGPVATDHAPSRRSKQPVMTGVMSRRATKRNALETTSGVRRRYRCHCQNHRCATDDTFILDSVI
jgi:hypothetical protein